MSSHSSRHVWAVETAAISRVAQRIGLRTVASQLGWRAWQVYLLLFGVVATMAAVSLVMSMRIAVGIASGYRPEMFRMLLALAFGTGGMFVIGLRAMAPPQSSLTLQLELLPVRRWVAALATSAPLLAGAFILAIIGCLPLLVVAARTTGPTWVRWAATSAVLGALTLGVMLGWAVTTGVINLVGKQLRWSSGFAADNAGVWIAFLVVLTISAYDFAGPAGWWVSWLGPAGALSTVIDPSPVGPARGTAVASLLVWVALAVLVMWRAVSAARHVESDHDACLSVVTSLLPAGSRGTRLLFDCLQTLRTPQFVVGLLLSGGSLACLIVLHRRFPGLGPLFVPLVIAGPYLGTLQLPGRNMANRWVGRLVAADGAYWRWSTVVATWLMGTGPAAALGVTALVAELMPASMILTTASTAMVVWAATLLASTLVPYPASTGGSAAAAPLAVVAMAGLILGVTGWLTGAGADSVVVTGLAVGGCVTAYRLCALDRPPS